MAYGHGLGNHPLVVIIGVIAALITVWSFVTDKPPYISEFRSFLENVTKSLPSENQSLPSDNRQTDTDKPWLKQLRNNPLIPGAGLAGISLGDSHNQVLRVLGKPMGTGWAPDEKGKPRSYQAAYWDSAYHVALAISFTLDPKMITRITLTNVPPSLSKGIPRAGPGVTIGSTKHEVVRSFGSPQRKYQFEDCPQELGSKGGNGYGYSGIDFIFCPPNDLVYQILIGWIYNPEE